MNEAFEKYLFSLRQDRDDKTELSDRGALETLLKAAGKNADPKIRIIHEGKGVPDKGGPDFKAMKAGMILGYVENKTIGARAGSCRSMKSAMFRRSPTRSPSPSTRWRRSTKLTSPPS